MADVFLSYARANQGQVKVLADAVARAGFSVWWDAELPPHRSYGEVITEQIAEAKAAIVVWSADSAASEWVRAEADLARNQKKLIQASLDDKLPPMPFNQIQYAFIGDWNGEVDHPGWRKIVASLNALCGRAPSPEVSRPREPAPPLPPMSPAPVREPARSGGGSTAAMVGGAALGVVVLGGAAVWLMQPKAEVPPELANTAAAAPVAAEKPAAGDAPAQRVASEAIDTPSVTEDPDGFTNVRAGPSTQAAIVARVLRGETFMAKPGKGEWWRVRTADGRTGWMFRRWIRPAGAGLAVAPPLPQTTVSGAETFDLAAGIADPRPGTTNVRASPSVQGAIVAEVDRDEPFTTYRQSGNWWRVRTRSGATGYMARNMIRVDGPAQ